MCIRDRGKIVPGVTGGARWPWVILGVLYALLGLSFVVYGYRRQRDVDEALARGEFERPDPRAVIALTVLGGVVGLLTLVLVVFAA